jgi:hypothetical protein
MKRSERPSAAMIPFLGSIFFLSLLASCGDGNPILFPEAHLVEVEPLGDLRGMAGEALSKPLVLVVRDRHGNGLAGLPVTLSVLEGGGTLGEPTRVTGREGEIRIRDWRMGERPGPNSLRIQAEGVEPVTVVVESGPGVPAELVFLGEVQGEWEVASTLTGLPQVRIRDRFGNPIPGSEVDFVPSQGGAVAGGPSLTGTDGTASTPDWVLSPQAGSQFLMARFGHGLVAFLRLTAHPGPPARVGFDTPLEQWVEVDLYLPHPPVVRVTDIHGNGIGGMPVEVVVVEGGGRVESLEEETDSLGRARVLRWYMGRDPGMNRLEARVPGLSPGLLLAHGVPPDAEPQGRYFRVARLHVNQANQSPAGSLPLIQGRPGLLRVWVTASEPQAPAPPVRIRLYRGGQLLEDVTRVPPTNFLQTDLGPDALAPSYDMHLQGAWIGPGLRVEVDVDPDYEVGVVTRRTGFFVQPEGEENFSLVSPAPFRVRFVPLRDSVSGVQGVITQDLLDAFMDQTRRMLPLAEDSPSLGEPFVVSLFGPDGRVRSVLSIMRSAWLMSDFRDHYMHGIFPTDVPRSFSGIAYRPSNPLNPAPIAMTIDRLPGASSVVAHELGHNLGVRHAPCGDPDGVDPNYPYVNARLGHPGYDYVGRRIMAPNLFYDLMSYCSPKWMSDYNFQLMLSWRLAAEPMAVAMAAAPPQAGLLVWGRMGPWGMALEPAVPVEVPPFLPAVEGPYRIRGLDEEGRELFSFRFQPDEVSHGDGGVEMEFAWVVPLGEELRDRVARLELHGPGGPGSQVSRERAGPEVGPYGASPDPSQAWTVRLERGVALEWDPSVFPVAWVRNPTSGQVVGMVESGRVDLSLWSHDVEILLTDGIRGWVPEPDGRVRAGSW